MAQLVLCRTCVLFLFALAAGAVAAGACEAEAVADVRSAAAAPANNEIAKDVLRVEHGVVYNTKSCQMCESLCSCFEASGILLKHMG